MTDFLDRAPKVHDTVRVEFDATVIDIDGEWIELAIQDSSGTLTNSLVEVSPTVHGTSVRVIAPPLIPDNAEVIRWWANPEPMHDGYWRYATRMGNPANKVWRIAGLSPTLEQASLESAIRADTTDTPEVLTKLD